MLYLVMILACAALVFAWSVDDGVTMAFAGVLFLGAATLKIGGRRFKNYLDRKRQQRAVDGWLAHHDIDRLLKLTRGELEGPVLLETLRHLDECTDCADRLRIIVLLRSGSVADKGDHVGVRHSNGDPRYLM